MRKPVDGITCPVCGKTSYHSYDIKEEFCGYCHAFTHHCFVSGCLWPTFQVLGSIASCDRHARELEGDPRSGVLPIASQEELRQSLLRLRDRLSGR